MDYTNFPNFTKFMLQNKSSEKRLLDVARVMAKEKLSGIIYERGVDDKGFTIIRSRGDAVLFGGFSTREMKSKLGVPADRSLADFLPTLTIKAKDFAAELTSHNVVEKELHGESSITQEHVENNQAVRQMLNDRGVRPECLPPSEDVKKVKRRLESEEKKIVDKTKKKTIE